MGVGVLVGLGPRHAGRVISSSQRKRGQIYFPRRRRPGDGLLQADLQSPPLAARPRPGNRLPAPHVANPGGAQPRYRTSGVGPVGAELERARSGVGGYARPGDHRLQPDPPLTPRGEWVYMPNWYPQEEGGCVGVALARDWRGRGPLVEWQCG